MPSKIEYPAVLSRDQVRELVSKYDWDVEIMTSVIMAESSGRKEVVNEHDSHKGCSGSYGLAQIACVHTNNVEELKDPEKNIEIAYSLYKQEGFNPWSAYKSGAYKKFMLN